MRQKLKISPARVIGILGLMMLLLMVRILQNHLFYDPLLPFFKSSKTDLPVYDTARLFLGLAFRYVLNSTISLGILWLAFKDRQVVKLSGILMLVFFCVACLCVTYSFTGGSAKSADNFLHKTIFNSASFSNSFPSCLLLSKTHAVI
jgi:exosortase F-associated protein